MPGIILGRSGVVKVGPLGNAIQGGPTDLREQCLDIPDRCGSVGQHLWATCVSCLGFSFFGLPPFLPRALAAWSPAWVRCRISARSKPFYERGDVRIRYEEAGSGFPLLLIPGGGLNSTISFFTGHAPFNAIEEFKDEYRCITADLRHTNGGQSSGPLEIDRRWDAYADDQLGLMGFP
jgi:hypothetical protein